MVLEGVDVGLTLGDGVRELLELADIVGVALACAVAVGVSVRDSDPEEVGDPVEGLEVGEDEALAVGGLGLCAR